MGKGGKFKTVILELSEYRSLPMHLEHQFFKIWIKYVLLEVDLRRIVWSDIL